MMDKLKVLVSKNLTLSATWHSSSEDFLSLFDILLPSFGSPHTLSQHAPLRAKHVASSAFVCPFLYFFSHFSCQSRSFPTAPTCGQYRVCRLEGGSVMPSLSTLTFHLFDL